MAKQKESKANRKAELEKIAAEAQKELWEIQRVEEKEEAKKLVGNFYRYRNSYSDDKCWWAYAKVVGTKGSSSLIWEFEIDCYGKLEVELKTCGWIDEWKPITEKKFQAEWEKVVRRINEYPPLGKE